MFKIQKQDDDGRWRDVRDTAGTPLTFADKTQARAQLDEMFPVLVGMAKYGGANRTRVIAVLEDEEEEAEKV